MSAPSSPSPPAPPPSTRFSRHTATTATSSSASLPAPSPSPPSPSPPPSPSLTLGLGLWLSVTWTSAHSLAYGYHIALLNGVREALVHDVGMGSYAFGCITAAFTLGGLVGSLSAGSVVRRLDVLKTLQLASACVAVGSAAIAVAPTGTTTRWAVGVLLVARLIIGLGCGLSTLAVPLRLAALASTPSQRAQFGLTHQLAVVVGVVVAQAAGLAAGVGQHGRWRWVPGGCAVVAGALCASSSSMMAGPAAAGPLAARQTTMPGHSGGDVERERQPLLLTPAKATTTTAVEQASSSALPPTARSLWEVTSTRKNRAGLTLLLIAHATQQLCGISPVIAYSTSILAPQHGSPVGAHGVHRLVSRSMFTTTISASALSTGQLALAIAAAKVPLTLAPVFLIKRLGSHTLLVASSLLVALFATTLSYALSSPSPLPHLTITSSIALVASFSFGLGPVVWCVLGEALPPEDRASAGSLATAVNWSLNFLTALAFLPLQDALARIPSPFFPHLVTSPADAAAKGNIFLVFAACSALGGLGIHLAYRRVEAEKRKRGEEPA